MSQYKVPDKMEKNYFFHFLLAADHPLKRFTWVSTTCELTHTQYYTQSCIRREIAKSRSYTCELKRGMNLAECKKQSFSRITYSLLLAIFQEEKFTGAVYIPKGRYYSH